jgi:hypothetical protein
VEKMDEVMAENIVGEEIKHTEEHKFCEKQNDEDMNNQVVYIKQESSIDNNN